MRQTRSKAKSEAQSSDSGPPAETRTVWQWQGDQEEQWEAYPDSSCRELDSALAAGTSSFTLSLESGYEYSIDLHNMLQINPVTKYKRKIRSQRVKTGRRREEEEEERGEWRREGGEREEEGYEYSIDLDNMLQINPVTKYKRKIRSQRVKTGRRREEEEEEEGREGGGERRRRREEEEEERGRREGREREEEGYEYSIDLHNMLQINPVTKYKRKIRSQAVKTETTATNVKEEETEKPPAAKKQKGQSKKQTKAEETMATNVKEEETEKPPAAKKQKGQSKKQTKAEETMATNVKEEKPPAAKKQKGQSKKQTKAEETTATNVKEEETEKPPTAKKQKGQNKKQTKAAPKEVKAEVFCAETVKTVVMKGKAPVDSECTTKLGKAHVFSEGDDVYDVMLNQTNLQFNNNKYYLIQLLEDDSSKSYSVWMRWGRVGKVGQNSLVSCGEDLAKAKKIFLKKFEDKTDNDWDFREFFEKVPGKYDLLFVDYKVNNKEVIRAEKVVQRKQSSLDPRVQSLLELICDLKAMEQCVLEMKFDTRKAPLGKLTPEQIRAGFRALRTIEDCLRRKGRKDELTDACNQFYTRIPHDFGLKTPPIIRTEDELKEKIKLLEALSDIQIAVKMVESSSGGDENLLDQRYKSLNCGLQPLEASAHEYQVIERYLQSTHASTHGDYTMTLLDVFSVDRADENQNLRHLHNRTLLWHGSRLTNWVGILSRGLRVAPPEAPVTGYMFGKGIYFADMSSKSGNYCFTSRQNNVGLLLLCEVALGDTNDLLVADYEAEKLPPGKHSTKGLGRSTPDPRNAVTLDGMTVPMGPGVPAGVPAGASHSRGFSLLYNEFIVYDPSQARMRFLLRVRFNYSSLW